MWDGGPVGKGRERHLFLFKDNLMLTKKKKAEKAGSLPTYEFKGLIDVGLIKYTYLIRCLYVSVHKYIHSDMHIYLLSIYEPLNRQCIPTWKSSLNRLLGRVD